MGWCGFLQTAGPAPRTLIPAWEASGRRREASSFPGSLMLLLFWKPRPWDPVGSFEGQEKSRCWGKQSPGLGQGPCSLRHSQDLLSLVLGGSHPPHREKGSQGSGEGAVTGLEKRREVVESGPRSS